MRRRGRRFWILLTAPVAVTLVIGLALTANAAIDDADEPATVTAAPGTGPQLWSNPATWPDHPPAAGEAVSIPAGTTIVLDQSTPDLAGVTVEGTLTFDRRDLDLTADWIMVHPGGTLQIGTAERPFTNRATITLNATDPDESVMGMGTRGILVDDGGRIDLHGTPPAVPWSRLDGHVEPGAERLRLERDPGWRAGDTIAIAPTDFFGVAETETALVNQVDGASVGLADPIAGFRWGQLQYATPTGMSLTPAALNTPADPTPTVLDERAEVANLTRNIVVQSADDQLWRDQGFGAHVMMMGHGTQAVIDGVQVLRGGQRGRTARYPVHFHLMSYAGGKSLGDVGAVLRNSTVSGSANRCVVLHASNGVSVENNVCHDIAGHAFFLEDAVERHNVLRGNLALRIRQSTEPLLDHERVDFQQGPSGFWITNPDNTVTGNAVADSVGPGMWLSFPNEAQGLSAGVDMQPVHLPIGVFESNVAHSNDGPGINIDWVQFNAEGEVRPNKWEPTSDGQPSGDHEKWVRVPLRKVTTYKNGDSGIWNRATLPDYEEWISADNVGVFFNGAGDNGVIRRSLIVGTSLNDKSTYPDEGGQPTAAGTYHSSFDITQNVIVNFPIDFTKPDGGAFETTAYYLRGVDLGLIRNKDNLLIRSEYGSRAPSPNVTGEHAFARSGAIHDPYGFWGPAGNYWTYDQPFYTGGAACVQVAPAGRNGVSCPGPYYGVGSFQLSEYPQYGEFNPKMPINVSRNDVTAVGSGGQWNIPDGETDDLLPNMRHFAMRKGGSYTLRFGSVVPAGDVSMRVENALTTGDSALLAISYSGAKTPKRVLATTVPGDDTPDPRFTREMTSAGSLAEVQSAAGTRFFQDKAANLIWVKVVGGLEAPYLNEANMDDLYHPFYLDLRAS